MIKPCQCGGELLVIVDDFGNGLEWMGQCKKCGNTTLNFDSEEDFEEAWNNRPREDELLAIIKRFVLALDKPDYGFFFGIVGDAKKLIDKYEGGE